MPISSRIGFQFSHYEGEKFQTFCCAENRSNDEVFISASLADVDRACELAAGAFLKYKSTSSELRASFLEEIALQLNLNREKLVHQFSKESSLPTNRGNSELDRTIFQLETFANVARASAWRNTIQQTNSQNDLNFHSHFEPIGPVAVFGASNFPFAYSTIGGDSASALAVGCPVIVKAHPMHAGTSDLVAEIILNAAKKFNLPEGVFSHLLDAGHQIGEAIVTNVHIQAIGFTGSIRGGRALMDLAAKRVRPIPVFAEMGSLNPVVFFESELVKKIDIWVEKFAYSISNDAGQFCTKPGLLFVPSIETGKKFAADLATKLEEINPIPQLHPTIFKAYLNQVESVFGAQNIEKPYHSKPVLRIVEGANFKSDQSVREEFFGPQSILVHYNSEEELLTFLNLLDGQLTATLIGSQDEIQTHLEVLETLKLKAGRIIFNGVPTGVTVCDAMVHGGAYPASSDSRFTAVGSKSVARFVRPIIFQSGKIIDLNAFSDR